MGTADSLKKPGQLRDTAQETRDTDIGTELWWSFGESHPQLMP